MDTLDDVGITDALRIGAAIFNSGAYHPAHDAWEPLWLDLPDSASRERLLHGLIQYTAATHHASTGNTAGASGLAASALDYLDELPTTFESVRLPPVRLQLRAIALDPTVVRRHDVPPLVVGGTAPMSADLTASLRRITGVILAEHDRPDIEIDPEMLHGLDTDAPIATLFEAYAVHPHDRGIIGERLHDHLEREETRSADVSGLFDDDHSM